MAKRLLKIALSFGIPLLLFALLLSIYIHTPKRANDRRVAIEKGMGVQKISQTLASQGIVHFPFLFRIYVQLSREGRGLQAGDYLFNEENTPKEVLVQLTHGKVLLVKVRIVEGWTLQQIADHLETLPFRKKGDLKEEFLKSATDREWIESLGLSVDSLEGYLYPETYHLAADASPQELLQTFVGEFKKNYEKVLQQKSTPSLAPQEIITLASIVEKETSLQEERPVIASVFLNRLGQGMLLQSDPTIIYGLKDFDGNIRREDIQNPHPYNTYVHHGLPPGPICNPSLTSIQAVFNPAQTDFFYFVSKKDGSHQFSKTREEHWQAVQEFQLNKTE